MIVARDMILQNRIQSRLHLTHISTAGSVELIRNAKKAKTPVTADATPHHLLLTRKLIQTYNTVYKVKPPLRTESDRLALIRGVQDGTIDCIASDHAPHTRDDKDKEFEYAPFGVIGLETSFAGDPRPAGQRQAAEPEPAGRALFQRAGAHPRPEGQRPDQTRPGSRLDA